MRRKWANFQEKTATKKSAQGVIEGILGVTRLLGSYLYIIGVLFAYLAGPPSRSTPSTRADRKAQMRVADEPWEGINRHIRPVINFRSRTLV